MALKIFEEIFCVFLEKQLLAVKNLNFSGLPKFFIAISIGVLCLNYVKLGRQEIGGIVRCLPDNISPDATALATARIAPKIYQGQPRIVC